MNRADDRYFRVLEAGLLVICALGLMLTLGVLGSGCATSNQAFLTAQKIEGGASDAITASYGAWRSFDAQHQEALLTGATSLADFRAKVADWRTGVQGPVDKAFTTARDALKTLNDGLSATNAIKNGDFTAAIVGVVNGVATVVQVLEQYGINIPLPKIGG